jgi:hypothetical protein
MSVRRPGLHARRIPGLGRRIPGIRTAIEPAARRIAGAGLTFIYHNHNFEFRKFGGKTGLQILMESTDPDWFQFEIDTYWVQMAAAIPPTGFFAWRPH